MRAWVAGGRRDRTMQEGSMKFVVAAVGSDSEETAALLERPGRRAPRVRPPPGRSRRGPPRASSDTRPTRRGGYLSCVLASDANREPALEALREARVVLWLHRARVFDVELLVRRRRLREARTLSEEERAATRPSSSSSGSRQGRTRMAIPASATAQTMKFASCFAPTPPFRATGSAGRR